MDDDRDGLGELSELGTKLFGKHGIMCFAQGKVPSRTICGDDPKGYAVGSLFVHGHEERCVEGAGVVRVKHLQPFDDAIADQEFSVNSNFP